MAREMRSSNARIRFLQQVFVCVTLMLFGRLAYLQYVQGPAFGRLAARQHGTILEVAPFRGAILDRNERELARSLPVHSIFADPRTVEHPAETATQLAPILDRSEDYLLKRLQDCEDQGYVFESAEASFEILTHNTLNTEEVGKDLDRNPSVDSLSVGNYAINIKY